MKHYFIYITCGSAEEASRIAAALVEERLAACANIIPGMRSVYRWKGIIEQADETVLIAKTTEHLTAKLAARVKELHAYECPCIVELPVTGGNPDFLRWIEDSVKSS
ncbi:MAG: divalent-cation tolerance protein CutA [Kiritimatiellia bacterium]